ncbi:MAG: translation initiation factor IF-2 N-terminal domain-containing protein, partial [Streptosporangiaceae bacterium]
MAKVRVYELAKEFGVESKAVMAKLTEMGEFVRSASSTIEAPVVRRLKEAFSAQQPRSQSGNGQRRAQQAAPAQSAASAGTAPSAPATAAAMESDGKGSVNGSTPAAPAAQARPQADAGTVPGDRPAAPAPNRPSAVVPTPFQSPQQAPGGPPSRPGSGDGGHREGSRADSARHTQSTI